LELPKDESYTTIAGFLMAKTGRVLGPGDSLEHDTGLFTVERVDNRRIILIRFDPSRKTEPIATVSSLVALIAGTPLAC
jgi:CBS domain containing-hemolysin-like protein